MSFRKQLVVSLLLFGVISAELLFLMPKARAAGIDCSPAEAHVIFGNGVWNDISQAHQSRRALQRTLATKVAGTSLDGLLRYGVAYNPTDGKLLDLLEVAIQTQQTDITQFWRWIAGLDLMPGWLQEELLAISAAFDEATVALNPAVRRHIQLYDKLVSERSKVVIVPHSQGNLFANIAWLGVHPDYRDSIGIVSVATPDSYVAGGGAYTTIHEDLVIALVPDALPSNLDNFAAINRADWSGHKFVNSYLAPSRPAKGRILNGIVDLVGRLTDPGEDLGFGVITTTLTWGANPDVDLHTFEPDGTHVYYARRAGNYGYLDRDDTNRYGPEHYYVSCDDLGPGRFSFGVNYYHGHSPERITLSVKAGDNLRTKSVTLNSPRYSGGNSSPVMLFDVSVTGSAEEGYKFVVE